ncbi:hypothetical protein MKW94_019358, partial [Papaver nudicaule]|nr:hypothetical protein [Papaver nudicaule]
ANQLKKPKTDEIFKLLHFVLFGRHMKAFKSNLSEFCGFPWHENEENHRSKIKERLDKHVVEKLLEFCDVLDIHVPKRSRTKK